MNERQALESVEAGLERLLVKHDLTGDDDLAVPGLRMAIIYIRSRIDASIDTDATLVLDRALPAPQRPGEAAEESGTTLRRTSEMFDTGTSTEKKRRRE